MSQDHRVSEVGLNLRGFWSSILKAEQLQCNCCRLSLTDQMQKVLKDGYPEASPGTSFRAAVIFFPNRHIIQKYQIFFPKSVLRFFHLYMCEQQQASILSTTDFLRALLGLMPCKCRMRGSGMCILGVGAAQHPLPSSTAPSSPDELVIRSVGLHSPGVSWTVLYHV